MAPTAQPSLETLVRSNEKLLKAMLALLSLKDEHFLGELKAVFAMASQQGSEIGQADPKVWAEIRRELAIIDAIVDGEAEEGAEGDGAPDRDGEGLQH